MTFIVLIKSSVLWSVHIGLLWCGILHWLTRLLTVVSLLLWGLLSTVVLLLLIVVGCPVVGVLRIHSRSFYSIYLLFIIIRYLYY
jgi:hypothetical protein